MGIVKEVEDGAGYGGGGGVGAYASGRESGLVHGFRFSFGGSGGRRGKYRQ